jgi:hypothetical protein
VVMSRLSYRICHINGFVKGLMDHVAIHLYHEPCIIKDSDYAFFFPIRLNLSKLLRNEEGLRCFVFVSQPQFRSVGIMIFEDRFLVMNNAG